MLRLIENPTLDTIINEGEYVNLRRSDDASARCILTREGSDLYLCTDRSVFSGGRPSHNVLTDVASLFGLASASSVHSWCMSTRSHGETIADYLHYIHEIDRPGGVRRGALTLEVGRAGDSRTAEPTTPELMLNNYEAREIYTGLHSYHDSHGRRMNMPVGDMKENQYRIGVELEIEAKNREMRDTITNLRTNWFFMETDGSLGSNGIEIVTIPLLPKDATNAKTWSPLVDYLKNKANSYQRSSCGLHVHIGREAFGKDETERQATLGKLLYFYYECLKPEDFNTKVFGRSVTYNERPFTCKESEAVKVLGTELMRDKKVREKVDKGLKDEANRTRYYDINIQNEATVEFRKGKGSICTERIVAIITYCDLMVKYCKMRPWTQLKKDDFLKFIRKYASKNSPLFRYLPTMGEE